MAERVNLFDRLPELYRLYDLEQMPPGQLRAFLGVAERAFGEIHHNIEQLYHDLFIEHCDPWIIPYIGDLLGTSPLKGDPADIRRDVANTIALRRRKGTIGAIALLTYNLTGWGVHAVELRERLAWTQHLNHQRPDRGGKPPYAEDTTPAVALPRGGTAPVRDPALLSLADSAFDPLARLADLRPPVPGGDVRINLPNLAIFLWRLEAYTVDYTSTSNGQVVATGVTGLGEATHVVRLIVDPLQRPLTLFNTSDVDVDARPLVVTELDETPGPMHRARLTTGSPSGRPSKYVAVDPSPSAKLGLRLDLPLVSLGVAAADWIFRGADLCAWETGLAEPLRNGEIAIDPQWGRIVVGVNSAAKANLVVAQGLLSHTYGAPGDVGAHPVDRPSLPDEFGGSPLALTIKVPDDMDLETALGSAVAGGGSLAIEITDSEIHDVNPAFIGGSIVEDGGHNIMLGRSLLVRSADGCRPIIRLAAPLRFRPATVTAGATNPMVRLEGLFLTRLDETFPAGQPLIARAALDALEIVHSTLDPGGFLVHPERNERAGFLAPQQPDQPPAVRLDEDHGFPPGPERAAFDDTTRVQIESSIVGPLLVDPDHTLVLERTIVDAGSGVDDDEATAGIALKGVGSGLTTEYASPTRVNGVTFFGKVFVESIDGTGGIWTQPLEVLNNQICCLRYSSFAAGANRLPQHYVSVVGARVRFVSEVFGQPGYGQLRLDTDFAVRERGPNDDAMGAFGFLLDAHKWRNIQIRYREFMPVGVRPLLIPVT